MIVLMIGLLLLFEEHKNCEELDGSTGAKCLLGKVIMVRLSSIPENKTCLSLYSCCVIKHFHFQYARTSFEEVYLGHNTRSAEVRPYQNVFRESTFGRRRYLSLASTRSDVALWRQSVHQTMKEHENAHQ